MEDLQDNESRAMAKTVMITGATDGIGKETARMLFEQGHNLLLHGRSTQKLDRVAGEIAYQAGGGRVETFVADLSRLEDVHALADAVGEAHQHLDVLINNAGIYSPGGKTADGLDVRFAVNTVAPFVLTQRLLPLLGTAGRVVNLSSAAQAPVNLKALAGEVAVADMEAYAQSKLALTMWSRLLGQKMKETGPVVVAVNPASLLGSRMVKSAFGVAGGDLRIGADILCRASLDDEFADAGGQYFDNDTGQFAAPHEDARDAQKCAAVVGVIEEIAARAQH